VPWQIDPNVKSAESVSWSKYPSDEASKALPEGWAEPDFIPPEEYWPLYFKQTSKQKKLPDVMLGIYLGSIFVSKNFKKLVETFEPVQHVFVPLVLELCDGATSKDDYFLLKFAGLTNGVVAEKSDVKPIYSRSGELGFYSAGYAPRITWREDAIQGRHLWADQYLPGRMFCSDEFFNELKIEKMGLFAADECFVA
jgi:hypothetical protein